jgi:Flp pilus assembly protein TadD
LQQDYQRALVDLDFALKLQPFHAGAQSGRGLTLMNMDRSAKARTQMLAAVDNNPWRSELALLADGAPLVLSRQDL